MRKCDVCQRERMDLSKIRDEWSTNEIKDICQSCEIAINDAFSAASEKLNKLQGRLKKSIFLEFLRVFPWKKERGS